MTPSRQSTTFLLFCDFPALPLRPTPFYFFRYFRCSSSSAITSPHYFGLHVQPRPRSFLTLSGCNSFQPIYFSHSSFNLLISLSLITLYHYLPRDQKYLSLSLFIHLPRSTSFLRLKGFRSISASVQKFGLAPPKLSL